MKLILLLLLTLPATSWSIPEDQFIPLWEEEALPYFEQMTKSEFKNQQGLLIKYWTLNKNATKSIVIVPGRTEPAKKYAELIYDLRHAKVNIYILDHQGQGDSSRILKDTHKGHVIRFQDYVSDFTQFMNLLPVKNQELYLLAHSMGGAIATHYLAKNPDTFKKAVLMAPMMELNTDPYSEVVARYFAKILVAVRKGTHYAPDYGPYIPSEDTFEKTPYTHSEVRFEAFKYLFVNYPDLALGGPTARWVHEALKATRRIHNLNIKTPVLLFQSGLDETVRPHRQKEFCRASFCSLKIIPDGKHELLMESDYIRDEVLNDIQLFFGMNLFPENR